MSAVLAAAGAREEAREGRRRAAGGGPRPSDGAGAGAAKGGAPAQTPAPAPASVREELERVGALPARYEAARASLVTNAPHLVQVHCAPSPPFNEATLSVVLLEGYPAADCGAVCRLRSNALDAGFVQRVEAACQAAADAGAGACGQALAAAELFARTMARARLAPAFDETRKIKALVAGARVLESKGQLVLPLREGKYALPVRVTVPATYPAEVPQISLDRSSACTFPNEFVVSFLAQAAKKADAVHRGGDTQPPKGDAAAVAATAAGDGGGDRASARGTAHQASVVAAHRAAVIRSNQQEVAAAQAKEAATRNARAAAKKAKLESERKPWHAPLNPKKEQRAALEANARRNLPEGDEASTAGRRRRKDATAANGSAAKCQPAYDPSRTDKCLLPMVRFLYESCVQALPRSVCPCCGERVLPSDPSELPSQPAKLRPERLVCGHWYHHHCLAEYIAHPPFGKRKLCADPSCGRVLLSDAFNTKEHHLAKAWQMKEARAREIKDVTDFFALKI